MKIYEGKDGAYVIFEKIGFCYHVTLRDSAGNVVDKVRCEDYKMALDYRKSFLKQARA